MIPEGSFNLLNLHCKCLTTYQQSRPKWIIILHSWYGWRGQYTVDNRYISWGPPLLYLAMRGESSWLTAADT